jgi:quercetin dioxygenase-like cupin family protein
MIHRPCRTGQKLDVAGLNEIIVIIDRSETELTEVGMNSWAPGLDGPPHAHEHKEQTLFILEGAGQFTVAAQTEPAAAGEVVFVPRSASLAVTAGPAGLRLVSFGTVVRR